MFPGMASRFARWAPVLLRVIVGYGFMAHGLAKLAHGPENFTHILSALGVPFPACCPGQRSWWNCSAARPSCWARWSR
jgi:uncharacterized membrane protein YphA (DoxX/SURF4 family)